MDREDIFRCCETLRLVSEGLDSEEQREAVRMAAFALLVVDMTSMHDALEKLISGNEAELTDTQVKHLKILGCNVEEQDKEE